MLVDDSCKSNANKTMPHQKQVLLKNFRRLIDQHYKSIKLPKEYADLLYVTPNHLNALAQDLSGKTAGELIRDRVLLEAKRLLTNANMTVTEIAFSLNFRDNSYFNRFFKKKEGITPDEFRKQFILPKKQERC
jgi:AraC-like DNA-binding protein